ncbi:MAG: heat-inducible transcriptional repressor HrcA [Lachnospiraceae bacterium]|nr:heat-inducible transcriptional repressor HrcA [Lachnospiraceae bacterium]MDE6253760.1 heat-inducible transcriptional repressor HrcA [Lachnospiraceae bacterium]
MELDERKLKILKAIVRNYLETGEPVGSRTISKYTDLNLSSATIRNEMSDLEDMGYIIQPHTSAGRIPSDKGYRLYVDNMMQEKSDELSKQQQEITEMKEFLTEKVEKVEELLQKTAKLLANNTNYATMVSSPRFAKRLKFIQLSLVDREKLLCVVVLEGNVIKNKIVTLSKDIDEETILKLNILLNSTLNGLTVEEINLGIISKITGQAGEQMELVRQILEIIAEVVGSGDDMKIYTSGTTNILKYPELSDSSHASELINVLEEKNQLTSLISVGESGEENTGIQVYIGNETPVKTMKDCSVVTMTYEIEDGVQGTIGIIGPKRMDYEKVVENLKTVKEQLDEAFKKN